MKQRKAILLRSLCCLQKSHDSWLEMKYSFHNWWRNCTRYASVLWCYSRNVLILRLSRNVNPNERLATPQRRSIFLHLSNNPNQEHFDFYNQNLRLISAVNKICNLQNRFHIRICLLTRNFLFRHEKIIINSITVGKIVPYVQYDIIVFKISVENHLWNVK